MNGSLPACRIAWRASLDAASMLLRDSEAHDLADEYGEAARKRHMAAGVLGELVAILGTGAPRVVVL